LIILARYTDTPAHALAWGVTIAGVIQFIWLLFNCGWAGFRLRLIRPQFTKDIRKMISRTLPAAVGAGVYQISLLIDTIIASLLPSGSISFLFFADRVNQLPLGVVGVAVGTALLPLMSRQLSISDYKGALDSQNRAIELSLFFTLPAAVGLVLLSEPTISVLFERGAFDAASAKSTAEALAMYAIGLPAYVVIKALIPGFFAREDTATPVKIAVFSLLINLILNLILMDPFLHKGIAAATAISAWCNALGLAFVLKRRGYFSLDKRNTVRLPRMVVASLLMGVMLFFSLIFLNKFFVYETPINLYILVTLVFAGLIIYFSFSFLIVAARWGEFKQLFQRNVT
jgi:putative peptidoglycan lipid II flippase